MPSCMAGPLLSVAPRRRRPSGARLSATALSNSSNALANRSTPSTTSASVTAVEVEAQSPAASARSCSASATPVGQARADVAVVAERVHGLRRHGVDRVGPDQLVDVEGVGIGRVLDAGGGPEQPLRRGAGVGQRASSAAPRSSPGSAGRRAWRWRWRSGRAAASAAAPRPAAGFGLQPRVDRLVDLGVDAADEEAGDAVRPCETSPPAACAASSPAMCASATSR